MKLRFWLPVIFAFSLFALLGAGLTLNPREVPSPLIGKSIPPFSLPVFNSDSLLTDASLKADKPHVVNFFASWCTPCLAEHPLLMEIGRSGTVEIVGINYKDATANAERWLQRHGNPYAKIAVDSNGATAIDWGVYGVPETYLVDANGIILYKHVGPLTWDIWRTHFQPVIGG